MNPFIALFEEPVRTLTALAYAWVLLGVLVLTWWAATRNALNLWDSYRDGWLYLPPPVWTLRAVGMCAIVAVDLLLLAGIVHVLT